MKDKERRINKKWKMKENKKYPYKGRITKNANPLGTYGVIKKDKNKLVQKFRTIVAARNYAKEMKRNLGDEFYVITLKDRHIEKL